MFIFRGHKVILKSLSTKEVNEDQIKMKEKRENEKKSVKKNLIISSKEVKKVLQIHEQILSHPESMMKTREIEVIQHILFLNF